MSYKSLYGIELAAGLRDFFSELDLKTQTHLLIMPEADYSSLKEYLKLKPLSQYVNFLPAYSKYHGSRDLALRKAWLHKTQSPGLFIATLDSLLKRTYLNKSIEIQPGMIMPDFKELGYIEKQLVSAPGEFRKFGYFCEVFSPCYLEPLRIEQVSNEISEIDLTNKKLNRASIPRLVEWDLSQRYLKSLELFLKRAGFDKNQIKANYLKNALDKTCAIHAFDKEFSSWIYRPDKTLEDFETRFKASPEFKFTHLDTNHIPKSTKIYVKKPLFEQADFYPFIKLTRKNIDLSKIQASLYVFLGNENSIKKELKLKGWPSESEKFLFMDKEFSQSFFNQKTKEVYICLKDLKKPEKKSSSFEIFQKRKRALKFSELNLGSLVVHKIHGVARFLGLEYMEDLQGDFLILEYRGGSKLLLPAYRSFEVKNYAEISSPKKSEFLLSTLGNREKWLKKQENVKKQLSLLVISLMELYQKRNSVKRKAFLNFPAEEADFEKSFPFPLTEGQKQALSEITNDMNQDKPMERLLIADVGFGKTEVALRASFKALLNNKQVAWVTPTTMLSLQHFKTFNNRLKEWGFKTSILNSLIDQKQRTKSLAELENGTGHLVIATHSLFNEKVRFKDLGLLILDEEHKFGVAQKEKLKKKNLTTDSLYLSATPIPRTLNQGLSGIKDISSIYESPPGRKAVKIESQIWSSEFIKSKCDFEKKRGGQILFVHNRIKTLSEKTDILQKLLPDYRIEQVHGQMPSKDLEVIMDQLLKKEIDLLVSTNIVESGLDFPFVQTIFIDQPEMLGLNQLYQLKGRVGRRETPSYCYLILPRFRKLQEKQEQRLRILETTDSLGKGMSLSLYDMEMRGSGELFGTKQSGHIKQIGEELYFEMLQEKLQNKDQALSVVTEINLPIPLGFPDSYIDDSRLKLFFYKNLSLADNFDELKSIQSEIQKSFGEFPQETLNLFKTLEIRILCQKRYIEKLTVKSKKLTISFSKDSRLNDKLILNIIKNNNINLVDEYSIQTEIDEEFLLKSVEEKVLLFQSSS